jgi:hypothetical protein
MTYNTAADMAEDLALNRRLTAAVAAEGILDPKGWLYPRNWQVVSQPGWAQAWDSAVAGGVTNPGEDEGVITDGMILSGVQAVINSEKPPTEPGAAPVLSSLEPASASITDADFEGHLRGTGFTEDTVIIWNGAEENTRFVDDTDVWTTVVPSVVTAPTVLDVYVRNGDGQVSGILPFTWEE